MLYITSLVLETLNSEILYDRGNISFDKYLARYLAVLILEIIGGICNF